ncbi:MAG: hypothetical protein HUU03_01020 [Planctomycetaceae bacterium]|nr:hypothetical protein [Planctomycetaceae bacterium]
MNNINGYPAAKGETVKYTVEDLQKLKDLCERHQVKLDMIAPPYLASSHIDRTRRPAIMTADGENRDRDIAEVQQLIREMQPRNPAVYSYLSWNEGYNIPGQFPDRARQLPWLARGLQTIHEGQRELPFDASLRLEEWHFVFNRTRDFPLEVLRLELEAWHEREPAWAAVVKSILASQDALTQARRDQLDAFPDQAVLPADLQDLLGSFDELDAPARAKLLDPAFDQLSETEQGSLGTDFDLVARQQLRAFLALDREVQVIVALANWARLHLMCAALEPVLNMKPRSLSADAALLNSYLYAQKNLPLGMEEAFTPRYRAGVKAAFAAGRALARAAYGEEGAEEFSVRMKENFNSLPGWLE